MNASDLYPLTFEPEYRSYIWGDRNLERLGRRIPAGIVAESWEISGLPASPTRVAAGPLAGELLTDLVARLGPALLGTDNRTAIEAGRFPLLVKLLDAAQKLSVQVHPDDEYARAHAGETWGKSEMWYVLEAAPDAEVILGLRRGVTPAAFREALEAGDLERWLHRVQVRAGDTVQVDAGAIHALLGGVVAVEIQQSSDTTYRVYDWNRVGADGKPRQLHVEQALDVADWSLIEPGVARPQPAESRPGAREVIAQTHAFRVERLILDAGVSHQGEADGRTFEIWACVAGSAVIEWAGGSLALPAVQFALLPAKLGRFWVRAAGGATLLRTTGSV